MRVLIIVVTTVTMVMAGNLLAQETDPARQIAEHWPRLLSTGRHKRRFGQSAKSGSMS
jgi:hypothetical protein